jgi:hypothetical protein
MLYKKHDLLNGIELCCKKINQSPLPSSPVADYIILKPEIISSDLDL